jgi:hypothetical protein
MTTRSVLTCATAIFLAAGLSATGAMQSQQLSTPPPGAAGRDFIVRIDPPVAATSCTFWHQETGALRGTGGIDARPTGNGAFAIHVGTVSPPPTSLKVSIWCRGAGMALVDVPAVETSGYERTVAVAPLKSIPLSGRVQLSLDGVSLSGADLRVLYQADWLCSFFGRPDCGIPQWEVASGRIGADNSVRVMVPDFASDPVVADWAKSQVFGTSSAGGFRLQVNRSVAPYDYWLEHGGGTFGVIPIAIAYQNLLLKPRRH